MMKKKVFISIELFILFILLPIGLVMHLTVWFKVTSVLIGFVYLIFVLLRIEKVSLKINRNLDWISFWKRTSFILLGIAILTTLYVYFIDANKLFCVPINKPILWIGILLVYTLISVWPQELIYRTFFFSRYENLFKSKKLFIFINAIVFCLAHLFFKNTLVLILTFIGGLIFGYTYLNTKSTLLVSIEHALYGNWLFTVGMGEMLAFPGMDSC